MYYDVQKSAERIKDLRTNNNLTQSEAAERMGFSLSGYRKLEQAQNGGSIDSLIMVADYYHISIDYLVYGEDRDYISSLSEGLTDSQPEKHCPCHNGKSDKEHKKISAEVTATRLQVTELWYLIFGKKVL